MSRKPRNSFDHFKIFPLVAELFYLLYLHCENEIFKPDGSFVKRFASRGQRNAPWGIAKAPTGFWGEGTDNTNVFLIGNFGDGRINAFGE